MYRNIGRPVTCALALGTLVLAAATAVPAFALTPAPISASLRDTAATPIELVQQRTQAQRKNQRQRTSHTYRNGYRDGYNAYAAAPGVRRGYGYNYGYQGYSNPWGHCVNLGEHTPGRSAFPDWDVC